MTAPNTKQQQAQQSAAQGIPTSTKGDLTMPQKGANAAQESEGAAAAGVANGDQNVPNGNTPAADGTDAAATPANASKSPGAAAAAAATPEGAAAEPDGPEAKEKAEAKKKEDELLAKGLAIAKTRHLLARAFTKPAEEPAVPMCLHDYMVAEMKWLAVDFSQERLWKQTTALALAYEVAQFKGNFALKAPADKKDRKYSEEIKALRMAAAKEAAPPASGRRSAAKAGSASLAVSGMKLDPADDPIFSDLDVTQMPGTPPLEEITLVYKCEEEFTAAVQATLMKSDLDRMIKEEVAFRSYNFEYEASLTSHLLAVINQQQQANQIADLGGFGYGDEDDDQLAGMKKGKRRAGNKRTGGYLLDDFAALGDDEFVGSGVGSKRTASKANLDSVYLHKNRVRKSNYRDADIDYELANETGGRYSTRRATGALRSGNGRGIGERGRRAGSQREQYQYQNNNVQRQRMQSGGAPGMPLWQRSESDLLLAVVHEFGLNWTIVSEVLSQSLGLQGIYRPPLACKQRFRQLTQQEGQDYTEDRAFATLANQITKQRARELLASSLPVRDDVLRPLMETLVQIGAAAKDRKMMEERRNEALRTRRQDMHQSYMTVLNGIMASTGGRHLSPLELSSLVSNAYQQQAQQQKMFQQQAQQAQAQMQAQQQQQAAVVAQQAAVAAQQAAAPQQGLPVQGQQAQQQPGANGLPAQQAAGAPVVGQQVVGMPPGVGGPPTNGQPVAGQIPGQPGAPQAGAAPGQPGMPPSQGSMGKAPVPGAGPPITLSTINQILQAGKMPNGQELTPEMRGALESRRDAMQLHITAMAAARNQAAAAAGQPAPSAASLAAMQATQQAAALQAGARPPLPPNMAGMPMAGVYGMPGAQQGMGGMVMPMGPQGQQPGVLPQQMAAQMAAAAAGGNVMPPAMQQQQMLMAQAQAQAQAQAAAAAAAKQANQ